MSDIRHVTVYGEDGIYAGWPANHGAWQWGDEFLVGFLRGAYAGSGRGHRVWPPYEHVQARSLDGGETWTMETTPILDEVPHAHEAPAFDLSDSIIRVRGSYDHGGDHVRPEGAFYLSHDRGREWSGPFEFKGHEEWLGPEEHLTSRTRTLGDYVFMSKARKHQWGTDQVFVVKKVGDRFEFVNTVCADEDRAVMPAVTVPWHWVLCAMRRRGAGCWLDLYGAPDIEAPWRFLGRIADVGGDNGNPPALINGKWALHCVTADRATRSLVDYRAFELDEPFIEWQRVVLRAGDDADIGYPQLFQRTDGKLVAVYYWGDPARIEATIFDY